MQFSQAHVKGVSFPDDKPCLTVLKLPILFNVWVLNNCSIDMTLSTKAAFCLWKSKTCGCLDCHLQCWAHKLSMTNRRHNQKHHGLAGNILAQSGTRED